MARFARARQQGVREEGVHERRGDDADRGGGGVGAPRKRREPGREVQQIERHDGDQPQPQQPREPAWCASRSSPADRRSPSSAWSPSRPSRRATQNAAEAPRLAPSRFRSAPHQKPNTAPPTSVSTSPEKSSAAAIVYAATKASGAHHGSRSAASSCSMPRGDRKSV